MVIDFLIGVFAANALPHFVFGCLDARVLGLFGYGGKANIAYAIFCTTVATILYVWKYGLESITQHMMLVGVMAVVLSYYFGWPMIARYLTQKIEPSEQQ